MSDETRPADGSAPKPYPDTDVDLVADALPGLVASSHGCTPSQCDLTEDLEPEEWRFIAKGVLRALAEAGRLRPDGERAHGMCGAEAPTLFGAGLDLHVCELLAGHNGWHARRNDDGSWMNWTDGAALTTDELDSTNGG